MQNLLCPSTCSAQLSVNHPGHVAGYISGYCTPAGLCDKGTAITLLVRRPVSEGRHPERLRAVAAA